MPRASYSKPSQVTETELATDLTAYTKKPGGTLTVATSGGDYTTVQAAVDAAALVAASTYLLQYVVCYPGVDMSDYTTPKAGVIVKKAFEAPGQDQVAPVDVPTPAAFVYRIDDGDNTGAGDGFWLTDHPGLLDILDLRVIETTTVTGIASNSIAVSSPTAYGRPVFVTLAGTTPGELTGGIDQIYYAIYIDTGHMKLAATYENAVAATPIPITITNFTPSEGNSIVINKLAYSSPANYLSRRGICPTMAIHADAKTSADNLSGAEMARLILDYGWEIACHSKTHTNLDGTLAKEFAEIVESKQTLEDAINTETGLDYTIKSFVPPGQWAGDYNLDSPTDRGLRFAQTIENLYECSQWYDGTRPYHSYPPQAHFGLPQGNIGIHSTNAEIDAFVEACASPGSITSIYHHKVVNHTENHIIATVHYDWWCTITQFKRYVDGLYTKIIDNETTCINLRAMPTCQLSAARFAGGVPYGYVDNITAIPNVPNASGTYIPAVSGVDITIESNVGDNTLHPWTSSKLIQCLAAGDNKAVSIYITSELPRDSYWTLKFDAVEVDTNKSVQCYSQIWYYENRLDAGTSDLSDLRFFTPARIAAPAPMTTGWATFSHSFYVPSGMRKVVCYIFAGYNDGMDIGFGFKIANLQLVRVG